MRRASCNNDSSLRQSPHTVTRQRVSLKQRQAEQQHRLRRACYIAKIWLLGDRGEFELVEHFIVAFDLDHDAVDRILDRFAGLDLEVLRAVGADRLPPQPFPGPMLPEDAR